MKIIAKIYNDYTEKFGIPRQSGLINENISRIVFQGEYKHPDAIRGIEEFSHLWLLWEFSQNSREDWKATVRPPRLGGNKRVGVFATRSPFRPNNIGLSCVRLIKAENGELFVTGADLLNGTPIYDIKPYLAYTDSHPEAKGGFAQEVFENNSQVEIREELLKRLPEDKRKPVISILQGNPKPAYHKDDQRIYGFSYGGYEIKFRAEKNKIIVTDILKVEE
ncbi:MAG: tRNA (N6-threonylcarbamoyladenosine(37)-N6)-methyltransferase TrmO [Clostridia bacterium]|nr:tRNA (N6-threonylcarbamoyladenosine(37)-N6)-methyltransferase TrmO [Clostridia bacterium]